MRARRSGYLPAMDSSPPDPGTPEPTTTDEVERDAERRRERGLEPLDPDAPGTWIVDPDGDAPEPGEPA